MSLVMGKIYLLGIVPNGRVAQIGWCVGPSNPFNEYCAILVFFPATLSDGYVVHYCCKSTFLEQKVLVVEGTTVLEKESLGISLT